MNKIARIVLAVVLLTGGLIALPTPASRMLAPDANAQIVPTPLQSLLPGDDDGDDDDDGGVLPGDDSGDSDGSDDSGSDGSDGSTKPTDKTKDKLSPKDKASKTNKKNKSASAAQTWMGSSHIGGSFSTSTLVNVARRMLALGVPKAEVISNVFPPFIIAGEAAWTDTWGAPRYGPGPIVRTHQGQDVFCRLGDPILAPDSGVVSYSDGGLGGITARVHTSSNSYWYLTHLSGTNSDIHPSGSQVATGDVVGFCGNTGNAITTPPHVHIGWYVGGKARNPMGKLVSWLRTAERRVLGQLSRSERRIVRQADARTMERLFGDSFAPDLSDLSASDSNVLSLSASPALGALAITGRALQESGLFSLEGLFGGSEFAAELGD